jgi:hypothetical protein
MDAMFVLVPVFIGVVFVIVIGTIIFKVTRSVGEWANNNAQPVLTVDARVMSKRTEVSGNYGHNTGGHTWTAYFVTFEMDNGIRSEFSIGGRAYGMLAEGDEGTLTFQGTRYHGFQRRIRSERIRS